MIADNLREVEQAIQKSCALSSRLRSDVQLIGVTKSVTAAEAEMLFLAGVDQMAENRVDKLLEKKNALADHEITWHLIGNLQRRKVKLIINEIDYFHALDSLSLAAEIDKRATKVIKCFVEVNVSGEASKQGVTPAELPAFMTALAEFPAITVVGLMTMAPNTEDEGLIRQVFAGLCDLQKKVRQMELSYAPCKDLSMGMSHDFPIAIEEGATFIRVGTALFKDA